MAAQEPDARGVEACLRAVDVPRAIREVSAAARELSGLRGAYLDGLALALQVMFDLAWSGSATERRWRTSGASRRASVARHRRPDRRRSARVMDLLGRAGRRAATSAELLGAVDAWRGERLVPRLG